MQEQYAPGALFWIICLAVIVFYIATMWKVFEKAGKPGWASIIPIYNTIVLLQISGKPGWWVLLYFIPVVNIVIAVIATLGLAHNFGKGTGFAIGLMLLGFIFLPILAWGDAQYQPQPV
jgi:uncharacterized membrane protein YhaH (DUF805 family)